MSRHEVRSIIMNTHTLQNTGW